MAEQKKVLSDLFGDDISAQARADLAKAGELAARELEEKIYGQERSLYDCFGPNPSPEAQAASQRAADLSMQDMMPGLSRKEELRILIGELEEAMVEIFRLEARDADCITWIEAVMVKEDLLTRIHQMIEEGV